MPRTASLGATERATLLRLQRLALRYFLDGQTPDGLVLDRQRNHGPAPRDPGLCSTAATGMGFIALALASDEPYRLLPRSEAVLRIRRALETALERLPHTAGVVPHFVHATTGEPAGFDHRSTIETAWLAAGALWAAEHLRDALLRWHAEKLFQRIDWQYWTNPATGLIRHGADRDGHFLPCDWDRLNGETVFMYVLAAGGEHVRTWPAKGWRALKPFYGDAAGRRFVSADLGLFVFQYGLDLLDLSEWREPGGIDLAQEAATAAEANRRFCGRLAEDFGTFRDYWGLSAGDGPPEPTRGASWPPGEVYRCYAPSGPCDGTAHLTATLASIEHLSGEVLENIDRALRESRLQPLGRYGLSCLNIDRAWAARDMVGIDAGAAILALDNFLCQNRVREVFHRISWVQEGLRRLRFVRAAGSILRAA